MNAQKAPGRLPSPTRCTSCAHGSPTCGEIREVLIEHSWTAVGATGNRSGRARYNGVEDAAAWEITINSNDSPLALNFNLFLSSVNWTAVFNGMIVLSDGFG